MAFVEFDNVFKTYTMGATQTHAIQGATFSLARGEFTVIVGPSGAGKTTILNLLGGMDPVTSGSIIVAGADLRLQPRVTDAYGDAIGFVFQFYNWCRT